MHKITQNCVCNVQNISGRSSAPDPAGGAYMTLPQSAGEGVNFLLRHLLLNAFGPSASRFVVFGDSSPMCPSQNNFLDPPLHHFSRVLLHFRSWLSAIITPKIQENIIGVDKVTLHACIFNRMIKCNQAKKICESERKTMQIYA